MPPHANLALIPAVDATLEIYNLDVAPEIPDLEATSESLEDPWSNPGLRLERRELSAPVVSCRSAAAAKDVPLEHELKSLLIACGHGYHIVAHVRGSRRLSLRAVKNALKVRQARLADLSDLAKFGAKPGTLSPFNDQLWVKKQLISRQVLALGWVTTNAGDDCGYVRFDPVLLLKARTHLVGEFEE
jgi:prolyl-tRNA editing enzyme YbaK/EbsC (Cys-tRNA(Pro) deacylase)